MGNYDTSAWQLPFDIVVPFDTGNLCGWYSMWMIQFKINLFYGAGFTAITSYFLACCLYIQAICDHFDLISNSFMENVEQNQCETNSTNCDRKSYLQVNQKMKQMVDIHVKIYE